MVVPGFFLVLLRGYDNDDNERPCPKSMHPFSPNSHFQDDAADFCFAKPQQQLFLPFNPPFPIP